MNFSFALGLFVCLVSLSCVKAHSWVHCVNYDRQTQKCNGLALWDNGDQIEESSLVQACAFNSSKIGCNEVCGPKTEIAKTGFPPSNVTSVIATVQSGSSIFMTWPSNEHVLVNNGPFNGINRSDTQIVILAAPDGVTTGAQGNTKPLATWAPVGDPMTFGDTCMSLDNWIWTEYGVTDFHGVCGAEWVVPKSAGCGLQMFSWMWMFSGGTYTNHTLGAPPLSFTPSESAYLSCFYLNITCDVLPLPGPPLVTPLPVTPVTSRRRRR